MGTVKQNREEFGRIVQSDPTLRELFGAARARPHGRPESPRARAVRREPRGGGTMKATMVTAEAAWAEAAEAEAKAEAAWAKADLATAKTAAAAAAAKAAK